MIPGTNRTAVMLSGGVVVVVDDYRNDYTNENNNGAVALKVNQRSSLKPKNSGGMLV